jgi:hypothetical protein
MSFPEIIGGHKVDRFSPRRPHGTRTAGLHAKAPRNFCTQTVDDAPD